jgi:hypothetical protein
MAGYTYTGASGRNYPYLLVSTNDLAALPMQAGNYVFAMNNAERTPVFIEATSGVRASVLRQNMAIWNRAKSEHGAELVLIHVDPALDMARRQSEQADLIASYYPPMNPNPDHPE